jgi:hypothetical protein
MVTKMAPFHHGSEELMTECSGKDIRKSEEGSIGQRFSGETVISAIEDQISCDLSDGSVILSLRDGIYYGLNPVGCRIWELIQKPIKIGDIQSTLLDEYEVEPERCAAEIQIFLGEMAEKNLIEIKDGNGACPAAPIEQPKAEQDS